MPEFSIVMRIPNCWEPLHVRPDGKMESFPQYINQGIFEAPTHRAATLKYFQKHGIKSSPQQRSDNSRDVLFVVYEERESQFDPVSCRSYGFKK